MKVDLAARSFKRANDVDVVLSTAAILSMVARERPPEAPLYPRPAKWPKVRYILGLKYAISDKEGHVNF